MDKLEQVTKLRRKAYENGPNAGWFLFLTPAVSQSDACDGTRVALTADGQEMAPGILQFLKSKLINTFMLSVLLVAIGNSVAIVSVNR